MSYYEEILVLLMDSNHLNNHSSCGHVSNNTSHGHGCPNHNVIVFMAYNVNPTQATHHVFNTTSLPSDNDHLFLPSAHSQPVNALI